MRSECQKEFGFNPYLVVQKCWFDNDSQLKYSDVDAIHNWFSAANNINWTLYETNNVKFGAVAPGFAYEGDPDRPFIDSNHGQTLINGLEGTANSGALITLCEGFTDAAETTSYWRSKDTTYYDYPNQRLNILRRYSQKAFSNKRIVQTEACDYFHDLTPGNEGESFPEGDLDIRKISDAFGGGMFLMQKLKNGWNGKKWPFLKMCNLKFVMLQNNQHKFSLFWMNRRFNSISCSNRWKSGLGYRQRCLFFYSAKLLSYY